MGSVTPRWLGNFGLTEPPFSKQIEDTDLWMPSSKKYLVDELYDAVDEHGSVLLVGEPGVGKTCVLRALRHRLPQDGYRLTYCHNATLGRRDFYRQLCLALGLSPKSTAAAVFYAVSSHVEDLGRDRVHPVFLLDEAQLLHQDVLDHLHILLNYQWDSKALLSIVLVGLPELWDRVELRRNRSLWTRVHTRLAIGAPLPEDTVEYVQYRMQLSGAQKPAFDSDALALLHEASSGALRDIDRIATLGLKTAARRKLRTVDRAIIEAVVDSQRGPEN
jgi:type II secretory pathway predicted ATPase ExeA